MSTWQAEQVGEGGSGLARGGQPRAGLVQGHRWGSRSFRHRVQFPSGVFVSTFYSFTMSDNTGRERHSEPRTRMEFLMKIATLQEPLSPTVFPTSRTQPHPEDAEGETQGGMMWSVSRSPRKHLMTDQSQDAISVTTSKTVLFLLHINMLIKLHEDPHWP